jgi:hypothetical protein
VSDRRDPLDNVSAYGGSGYAHEPTTPWGVQAPGQGENRPAQQRAARELELATTAEDARGLGPLSAGVTGVLFMLVSAVLLWAVGGLAGFFFAVVTGGVAVMFGLRSRRSARYARNRAWWLGMTAVVLTIVSFVAVLTLNVLVPDKSRGGVSCVLTTSCPRGTGA